MLALALVAIPAVVFAGGIKGKAKAEPPLRDVKADFKFVASGEVLTITGKGKGFDPEATYVSLVYGKGSLVEGPEACEPAGTLDMDLMLVGEWDVSDKGKRTLNNLGVGPASGAPLDLIGTISVRRLVFIPPLGGEFPIVVEACGAVK